MRRMIIVTIGFAVVAAGCSGRTTGDLGAPRETAASESLNAPYAAVIRNSYLEGCMTEQNREFCECSLTGLEQMFTEEEFFRFAIDATEEMPSEALGVVLACIDEADIGASATSPPDTPAPTLPPVTALPTLPPVTAVPTLPPVTAVPSGMPPGTQYNAYEMITHDSGLLEMSVPVQWSDHQFGTWQLNGEFIGPAVSASPNLQAYNDAWSTPGVFLAASDVLDMTTDELLDSLDFSGVCEYDTRRAYDDGEYVGAFDGWLNCGGTTSEYVVVVTEPYGGGVIVFIESIVVTEADREAVSQVLMTFRWLGGVGG